MDERHDGKTGYLRSYARTNEEALGLEIYVLLNDEYKACSPFFFLAMHEALTYPNATAQTFSVYAAGDKGAGCCLKLS